MAPPVIPTPGTPPEPPTSTWGAWQGRVNWIVTILVTLATLYLMVIEAKRPATTLQPTQAPVAAPTPAVEVPPIAVPAAVPAPTPGDVLPVTPAQAPLGMYLGHPTKMRPGPSTPLALGCLLMPFAGLYRRQRDRLRLLAHRGLLVALGIVCFIGAAGCARLTDQVKADSVSAVALWGQYVQGDAHLTPAQKSDRVTLGQQQTYIGTSGWASKAYVDVAQTITCQLDRYVTGDVALGADVRAGLVKMDRGIRLALKLPGDCPAPGVTP